jgi:hypothetical protein
MLPLLFRTRVAFKQPLPLVVRDDDENVTARVYPSRRLIKGSGTPRPFLNE